VLIGVVRLLLARQRGNLSAVAEEARRLQAMAEAPEAAWAIRPATAGRSASPWRCCGWRRTTRAAAAALAPVLDPGFRS